jgi:arginyl-tRNA synthetase
MIDDQVRSHLAVAVEAAGGDPELVVVEPPRDPRHGDLSTNIALLLAKALRRRPLDLASQIVAALPRRNELIAETTVAPPGFINIRLSQEALLDELARILTHPGSYGSSTQGEGRAVQVEFVSANPTGPLNVVSARAAAVGDTLVRLLRAVGYDARSEFYVNDAGNQVDLLAESFAFRLAEHTGRVGEPGLPARIPDEGYQGAYITDLAATLPQARARALLDAWRNGERTSVRDEVLDASLHSQRTDLERFRVSFDVWCRESALHERQDGAESPVARVLEELRTRGHVYEHDGALWFRSTDFGDDKDRVLVRADGRPTYLLPDIAYHRRKRQTGFDKVIDIWGPDHHGYVARMQAAVQALGYGADWLEILILQQVTLKRGGEIVKMSKRAGEFVTLAELVDEVGVDAARFFFLMRRTSSPLDFDLTLAREASEANPVYYVQYAHARIVHVLAHAAERGTVPVEDTADLALLDSPHELGLVRVLAAFPRTVLGAALAREPHRVTAFLQEVAAAFHGFYHTHRIVTDDLPRTRARLALSRATQIVLRRGLDLIGVTAPEEM